MGLFTETELGATATPPHTQPFATTDEELRSLIAAVTFKPSKPDGIYKDQPHEYICRKDSPAKEALMLAMKHRIKERGVKHRYDGGTKKPYMQTYYLFDGHIYWAFWLILNRCRPEQWPNDHPPKFA